jgi:hypothetical protein
MNRLLFRCGLFLCLSTFVSLLFCTKLSVDGGSGSTTTNGFVTGSILDSNGNPASLTVVRLLPNTFDPVKDAPLPDSLIDTTTSSGKYCFAVPENITYNLQAQQITGDRCALITGVSVPESDTIKVPATKLAEPGAISINLPDSMNISGAYAYIPGTTFFVRLDINGACIPEIPAGSIPAIYYGRMSNDGYTVVTTNILVSSGDTVSVFNNGIWAHSKNLYLNTSATGADITSNIINFPILIRLNSGNFDFSQAQPTGSDIRFNKADGSRLPYEIERWDRSGSRAEIWVKIDTVYGNNENQYITMYWGAPETLSISNGPEVFDTAAGFLGVWHLAESGNTTAFDATAHHYDGTPSDSAPQTTEGVIGNALQFDGNSNGLVMKNTAKSPLNFPRPGTYTFSAWVSVDTVLIEDQLIAGKGFDQYALRIKGSPNMSAGMFALHEYVGAPIYGTELRQAPVVVRQWKYMVGIRDIAGSYLFIDGKCVDSIGTIIYGGGDPADTTNFSIGRCATSFVSTTNPNDYLPFRGKVDEVRIARGRFSADWIKLSYMNQRPDDMLIKPAK